MARSLARARARRAAAAALAAAGFIMAGAAAAQDRPAYTVSIAPHDNRSVRVHARIPLTDSVLLMYPDGANHLADGWSTFVRGLRATDDAGRAVPLRRRGRDEWAVAAPLPAAVTLDYEVLVHHDAGRWPFGSKESAYGRPDAVFLTGKALFIAQYGVADATVRFDLDPSWRLAVPWAEVPGQPRTFSVPTVIELLEVGMMAGRHQQRAVTVGGTEVVLAVGESLRGSAEVMEGSLRQLLPAAAAMFGGAPRGRFVVIANRDVYDGGTAFTRSFSVVYAEAPTVQNRTGWGHVIAHELLHLWLGSAIRTAPESQQYWFSEGYSDYLSSLLELRTGMISEPAFWARVAEHHQKYTRVAGGVSLLAAGADKAQNYDLVYSGGFLAALSMDVDLRRRTARRAGVEDVLRRMYARFGATGDPYTDHDVRAEAEAVGGGGLSAFFASYVTGTDLLPVQSDLAALGMALHAAGPDSAMHRITVSRYATPAQTALRRAVLFGADGAAR
ncbi:MAG TPA: hypothetical protein VF665_12170 [Longimicrobium sp.]|uniref:M61 family metallopeptidase n=1 Tax=Longimicrobium sp. TaxID=2029185 RepID=UPI002ED9B392